MTGGRGGALILVACCAIAAGIAVGSAVWSIFGRPSPNDLALAGGVLTIFNIAAVLWARDQK